MGKKAETSVDLTNEAQHVGIREVSLESAEEKSAVDHPDTVCSFLIIIIHICVKTSFVHSSQHAEATLMK